MYLEDPNTSLQAGLPPVPGGDMSQWARGAKPVDLWDAWLFSAAESSLMLQAWGVAAREQRVGAYAGYRAALDREEQAALVLANRLTTWPEGT